jgi:hypothetical protein
MTRGRNLFAAALFAACAALATDRPAYEMPPVNYSESTPADPVADMFARIARGEQKLTHDAAHGYLRSFLALMQVPVSSQTLVFSKTSFQRQKIWPRLPRALYFSDDVYVGWVNNGDVLEISTVDPQLGAIFYTLSQRPGEKPELVRQTHNCLQCHESAAQTLGVPGHVVRSVFPNDEGMPHYSMGTFRTTPTSPYNERWGGWYVTGEHGAMRHLGNVIFPEEKNPDLKLFGELGANRTDLSPMVSIANYLTDSSDIVALLVMEHQTYVHNLLTRANQETRLAVLQSNDINKLTHTPPEQLTDGSRSRIRSNCDPLVEALFFCGEPALPDPVKGTSTFRADFEQRGSADTEGRSLRQFDLHTRLFKYPCSFLVYSRAFAGLPREARTYVVARMKAVLDGSEKNPAFAHLSADDRRNIAAILKATHPDFAGGN